jgi:hypothetical protein
MPEIEPDLEAALRALDKEELKVKLEAFVKKQNQDKQDERNLSGDFEPPHGTCGICGGEVVPRKVFREPYAGVCVAWWYCNECGLMYNHVTGSASASSKATP